MMPAKKRTKQELDFQADFYEKILKERPDFVEALMALGEIYTKEGFCQKGLEIDKRLAVLRPDNFIVRYNLACSLSLTGDVAGSFGELKTAIRLGYRDFEFMEQDPDLKNLRSSGYFWGLFKKIKREVLETQNVRKGC